MGLTLRDLLPYAPGVINTGLALLSNNSANKQQNTANERYNTIEDMRLALAAKNDSRGDTLMNRYTNTFLPLQDQVIGLAKRKVNPDVEAGIAGADVEQAVTAQRGALKRQYGRMGVNPNDGAAIDAESRLALNAGLGKAAAMTGARRTAKDVEMNRLLTAAQLGTSLPGQAAQFTGLTGSALSEVLARRGSDLTNANNLAQGAGANLGSTIGDLVGGAVAPESPLWNLLGGGAAGAAIPEGALANVGSGSELADLTNGMGESAGSAINSSLGLAGAGAATEGALGAASAVPAGVVEIGALLPAASSAAGIGAGAAGAAALGSGLSAVGAPALGIAEMAAAGGEAAAATLGGGAAAGGGFTGALAAAAPYAAAALAAYGLYKAFGKKKAGTRGTYDATTGQATITKTNLDSKASKRGMTITDADVQQFYAPALARYAQQVKAGVVDKAGAAAYLPSRADTPYLSDEEYQFLSDQFVKLNKGKKDMFATIRKAEKKASKVAANGGLGSVVKYAGV